MIAIIEAIRAGLFRKDNILRNVIAGIVVAIITLPLSMAFAIASGAKPEAGIYTSIVAVTVVSLFGGSRVQITGPTSAFVGVLLGVSSRYGPEGLQIATIMAGIMILLLGVFKCGQMIKFIPEQVIAGFTAGIGVNMLIGQVPNFFGLKCGHLPANICDKLKILGQAFSSQNTPTTCLAIASLLVMVIAPKTFLRKIPAPLLTLIFGMAMQAIFRFESVATIGSVFGGLSNKLPYHTPTPALSFDLIQKLLAPAFAIAMLGAIESLLCAVIADSLAGTKHSSNQELIGHGIANMISPMFGGIATTGSIARTIASIKMGGNCPIAGLVSAFVLCLILCLLSPLAKFVPLSSLAAILFVVAFRMVNHKHVYNLLVYAPKSDAVVLILTFGLTLFCGIVVAVNVGVMLSALLLMNRMAGSSHIDRVNKRKYLDYDFSQVPTGIAIYSVSGPIFFGMIDKFSCAFSSVGKDDRVIILRMFDVPFIDATGLENLHLIISSFKKRGIFIMLSEANDAVMDKLKRSYMKKNPIIKMADKSIIEILDIANKMLSE
ncbi:MAG: STAS domain-containing protein [Puniceicoccales bacterium]|jgi:SulP family sulfate permease|nr:STAS domain-containing protein [Puniceicoccales bacterium]